MKENKLKEKSKVFEIKNVNLYKLLISEKKEFNLSRQLLRSGASIGANVREAEFAESKADFIHKMAISQKETNETISCIALLVETHLILRNNLKVII